MQATDGILHAGRDEKTGRSLRDRSEEQDLSVPTRAGGDSTQGETACKSWDGNLQWRDGGEDRGAAACRRQVATGETIEGVQQCWMRVGREEAATGVLRTAPSVSPVVVT